MSTSMKNVVAIRENLHLPLDTDVLEEKTYLSLYDEKGELLKRSRPFENDGQGDLFYNNLHFISLPSQPVVVAWESLINFVNSK